MEKRYVSGSAALEEHGAYLYRFETESTVYAALRKLLEESSEWRETSHASHFNLLLGERWKIPYARLGQGTTLRQVGDSTIQSADPSAPTLNPLASSKCMQRSPVEDLVCRSAKTRAMTLTKQAVMCFGLPTCVSTAF